MTRVRWQLAVLILVSSCVCASPAKSGKIPAVKNSSYEVGGERVLRHEMIMKAPLEQVWHSFTTPEGLRTWVAPVVEFELRTGGRFHTTYQREGRVGDPGTIYNTVLSYVPLRMLTFKIGLTQAFPEAPRQASTLFAVAEFEPLGKSKTRVTLSMVGWGRGKEWDEVYGFFEKNNPIVMTSLRDALAAGAADSRKQEIASRGKQ
jgi:uncharacterized protein YndB with AHSA1/START domain